MELPKKNPNQNSNLPSLNTGPFQGWHCKKWNLPSLVGQLSLTQADDSISHSFLSTLDQISVTFYLETKEEVVLVFHLMGITGAYLPYKRWRQNPGNYKAWHEKWRRKRLSPLCFTKLTSYSCKHVPSGVPKSLFGPAQIQQVKIFTLWCRLPVLNGMSSCMEFWVWKAAFPKS